MHRYTITYQKQVRKKTMLELELTKCKGIGDKKAAAIYKQFKTKAALKAATAQELAKAAKIGPEAGQALYDYIQQQF